MLCAPSPSEPPLFGELSPCLISSHNRGQYRFTNNTRFGDQRRPGFASLTNSVGHTARIRRAVRGPATEYACPVPLHLDAWGHNVSPDPALRSLGIRSLASPWTAKLGRREADVLCVGISQTRQRGTGASHSPRQRRLTFLWDALSMLPFEAPRSTWRWIAFDRCTDERNGSSIAESCDPLTGTSRCDVASGMSCSLFHLI